MMDFEFNPISKPVASFVFIIAGFMAFFGVYFLSMVNGENYLFVIPASTLFLLWLPFWVLLYRSSKIRFTKDRILKSSFFGKREMRKDRVRFFGIVYRHRYSFRIIPPEQAVAFALNGNCQIFISEVPASEVKGTQLETIKIPFQREAYDKIKTWMEPLREG
jgi:hypothetical protein